MSKPPRREDFSPHELINEADFLKQQDFDALVRQRMRLEQDPLFRRRKIREKTARKVNQQAGQRVNQTIGRRMDQRADQRAGIKVGKGGKRGKSLRQPPAAPKPQYSKPAYAQFLLLKGEITADLYRASLDYELAYMAITDQLGYCVSKLEPKRDRSWVGADESVRRILLQHSYSEWRSKACPLTRRVLYEIIINGTGVKALERDCGVRSGSIKRCFIQGLEDFVRAGVLVTRRARHFSRKKQAVI